MNDMPGSDGQPGVGELGRQLQAVLIRFETLANGLEQKFVNKEVNRVDRQLIDETIRGIREAHSALKKVVDQHEDRHATKVELETIKKSVKALDEEFHEDKTWLYRLVIGALILAILSAAISGGFQLGSR